MVVAAGRNAYLKGLLPSSSSRVLEVKEEGEGMVPNLSKEVVEGMVGAVVDLNVVGWHLSSMALLKNIIKAGELSREEVGHRSSIAVVLAAWVVAVGEDLLMLALLDHQFPSCTKQPRFHIKLGLPLSQCSLGNPQNCILRLALRLDNLSHHK